jgi:hypothetical protein
VPYFCCVCDLIQVLRRLIFNAKHIFVPPAFHQASFVVVMLNASVSKTRCIAELHRGICEKEMHNSCLSSI